MKLNKCGEGPSVYRKKILTLLCYNIVKIPLQQRQRQIITPCQNKLKPLALLPCYSLMIGSIFILQACGLNENNLQYSQQPTNVFLSHSFSEQKIIEKTLNLSSEEDSTNTELGIHTILYTRDIELSNYSISTTKPTLLKPTLRACLYYNDTKVPFKQKFYITTFSDLKPILKQADFDGCVEWQETIEGFRYYSNQRWYKKEIKICSDNSGNSCVSRIIYMNPWGYEFNNGNFIWHQGKELTTTPPSKNIHGSSDFKEILPAISISTFAFNFNKRNFTITKNLSLESHRLYHISLMPKIKYMTFRGIKESNLNGEYKLSYLLEKTHGETESSITSYSKESEERKTILKKDKVCFSNISLIKDYKTRMACHKHTVIDYSKSPMYVKSSNNLIKAKLTLKFADIRYVMSRNKIYFQIMPADKKMKIQKNSFYGAIIPTVRSEHQNLLEHSKKNKYSLENDTSYEGKLAQFHERNETVNEIIEHITNKNYLNQKNLMYEHASSLNIFTFTAGITDDSKSSSNYTDYVKRSIDSNKNLGLEINFSSTEINHLFTPENITLKNEKSAGLLKRTEENHNILRKACSLLYPKNQKVAKAFAEEIRKNKIMEYKELVASFNEINKSFFKYITDSSEEDLKNDENYFKKISQKCSPSAPTKYIDPRIRKNNADFKTKKCEEVFGYWNQIYHNVKGSWNAYSQDKNEALDLVRKEAEFFARKAPGFSNIRKEVLEKIYEIDISSEKLLINPETQPLNITELQELCFEKPLEFLSVSYTEQIKEMKNTGPAEYRKANTTNLFSGIFLAHYNYNTKAKRHGIEENLAHNKSAIVHNSNMFNISIGLSKSIYIADFSAKNNSSHGSSMNAGIQGNKAFQKITAIEEGKSKWRGSSNNMFQTINTESLTFVFQAKTKNCIRILRENFILTNDKNDSENSKSLFLCQNKLNDWREYEETWYYTYLYFRNHSSALHDPAGDLMQRPITSLIRGDTQYYLFEELLTSSSKIPEFYNVVSEMTQSAQEIYRYYKIHHNFPGLIYDKVLTWAE